jgi:hypothetical protein
MLKLCKNGTIPALIALLAGSAIGEEKWELIKDKDGLKIYTREFPGSDIKELKTVGRIKAPVKRLVDIQFDMQSQTQWVPLCKTARLIKKLSDNQVQVYREIDNPWPFKNSDYVVELNLKSDDQTGESMVEFHEVKDAYPAQDCCGRMSKLRGFWKFAPVESGVTEVTYQVHLHPGGKSPSAFINMSMGMIGKDTFNALKDYVKTSTQLVEKN